MYRSIKEKLLVICGPTAAGKTSLGLKLAREFNGEIISADSRQAYQGMDIGTGKEISNMKYGISDIQIKKKQSLLLRNKQSLFFKNKQSLFSRQLENQKFIIYKLQGISVWLWDVIPLDQRFSAGEYARLARLVIKDVWQRGKLPILLGGTGFYIKTVVDGIETMGVKPDWKFRKQLEKFTVDELTKILKIIDLERYEKMNQSDRKNRRRLIRAIEVAKYQKLKTKNQKHKLKIKNILFIGLGAVREVLYERIDRNVERRVKNGIIYEINGLLNQGYKWSDPGFNTLGYKEWRQFFAGRMTMDQVIKRWRNNEHDYARRQLTWFKKDKRIHWFDISQVDYYQSIVTLTKEWYNSFQDDHKN